MERRPLLGSALDIKLSLGHNAGNGKQFLYFVIEIVVLQVGEIEAVEHSEITFLQVDGLKLHVLMGIFHLCHGRMRTAIGVDQSVVKEVSVARGVCSEVATIGIEGSGRGELGRIFLVIGSQRMVGFEARQLAIDEQSLVYPVPNEATLQVRILIDSFPLAMKITRRVTHCVGIFRRHDRPITAFTSYLLQPSSAGVLWYEHVSVPFPLRTLIVYGAIHPLLVLLFQPKISLIEVKSVAGFVS